MRLMIKVMRKIKIPAISLTCKFMRDFLNLLYTLFITLKNRINSLMPLESLISIEREPSSERINQPSNT